MDAPRHVQQLRADVPPEVATIVHCLLAKRPEDRFQSASALAKALASWSSGTANAALLDGPPPPAEAVEPLSDVAETSDPFNFGHETDGDSPAPADRPSSGRSARRSSALPGATKRLWIKVAMIAAVFAIFLCLGAIVTSVIIGGRKKGDDTTSPPPRRELPKNESAKAVPPKPRPDPPPAKDLETVEKFLPDDASAVAIFDLKQWQAPIVRPIVLGPLDNQLAGFRSATGVDLLSTVERVVVGLSPDEQAVIVLQGRGLVTPRLIDGVKALPGVQVEPASDAGQELVIIRDEKTGKSIYGAASESSVILSAHRGRLTEVQEKRDSGRRTRLNDPTIARGLEYAYARPFAAYFVLGLRQEWAKLVPAASKLNFAAAGIVFDERGMYFHTLADETEFGKAVELQRAFGRMLADQARATSPPDARIERLAGLLVDAEVTRLPPPKLRLTHTQYLVPARKLEEWFAPFFPKGEG
jgi:hypothetical protein